MTPVAGDGGDRFGKVMKVQHDVRNILRDEPADDAGDERFGADGHGRFGSDAGQRHEPRAESCRQHERGPASSHRAVQRAISRPTDTGAREVNIARATSSRANAYMVK